MKLRTSGHFWQSRYYSCPLDQIHQWTAIAYVERNPVRAGMVSQAEDYAWSSAPMRLSGSDASGFLDLGSWKRCYSRERWRDILATGNFGDGEIWYEVAYDGGTLTWSKPFGLGAALLSGANGRLVSSGVAKVCISKNANKGLRTAGFERNRPFQWRWRA